MTRVVMFGTGSMAALVHQYLTYDSPFEVVAFAIDADHQQDDRFRGLPVVPFEDVERDYPPDSFAFSVPIMYSRVNCLRAEKFDQAKAKGYRLVSWVSSRAHTWPDLTTGENCLIGEGSIIQPFARLGDDIVMSPGAFVGHGSVIDDHCFLAPCTVVLGETRVGRCCFLGANATVRDGITLGPGCIVGAGVTVRRSAAARQIFVPVRVNPARRLADPRIRDVAAVGASGNGASPAITGGGPSE